MASPTRWAGVCDRQGGLACCGSWGRKESDTTERLNGSELRLLMGGTAQFLRYEPTWLPSPPAED